jgi:hypothetical protein
VRAALRLTSLCAALLGAVLLGAPAAQAGVLRVCEEPPEPSAEQQDLLFRFGAIVKEELERSGQPLALVARSGLDLARFGQRYSHAGISLKASANTPWSVRQLYYACDEKRPRIYDQGLSGFLFGSNDLREGYISMLLLPAEAAAALERAALDDARAVRLLGPVYSANAYPFALDYQNCNQWVMELLAAAWGAPQPVQGREQAQAWLREAGYEPTRFEVGNPVLMLAGKLVPWLHDDDHPADDLAQQRYQVSMPASIEAFVRQRLPQAQRIEICHADRRVVLRRGWEPIAEGCQPAPDDTVITLN